MGEAHVNQSKNNDIRLDKLFDDPANQRQVIEQFGS
jgi:hypothetical protein